MIDDDGMKIVRRVYAKQIMAAAQVADERIENGFAEIRREDFLGPGPWPIVRFFGDYVTTPSADPVYLYADHLIGLAPERSLNNGQPSLHAYLLGCATPRTGEHVVHVGAGVGYYSAIMGHLVGPSGRVTAIEFEPDLAARAQANLSNFPNVSVVQGDGTAAPFDPADVIYVNAGATRPADIWLDRLKTDGRLVLPLTTDKGFGVKKIRDIKRSGAVFLVTRQGDDFFARWISPVAIYPCEGLRDEASERALENAFERPLIAAREREDWRRVTRLYRIDDLPDERCWLKGEGWSLAYE